MGQRASSALASTVGDPLHLRVPSTLALSSSSAGPRWRQLSPRAPRWILGDCSESAAGKRWAFVCLGFLRSPLLLHRSPIALITRTRPLPAPPRSSLLDVCSALQPSPFPFSPLSLFPFTSALSSHSTSSFPAGQDHSLAPTRRARARQAARYRTVPSARRRIRASSPVKAASH